MWFLLTLLYNATALPQVRGTVYTFFRRLHMLFLPGPLAAIGPAHAAHLSSCSCGAVRWATFAKLSANAATRRYTLVLNGRLLLWHLIAVAL